MILHKHKGDVNIEEIFHKGEWISNEEYLNEDLKKILEIKKIMDIPLEELIDGTHYTPRDAINQIKEILERKG